MVRDIIQLILDFFIATKSWIITDIDWGTLALLCLAAAGGLRWIAGKYTKNFNSDELSQKWFGAGRGLVWVHNGRNRVLKWGLAAASICLAFTFMAIGSTTKGQIADAGSALTSLKSGPCVIIQNCGLEGDKTVLYCRQLYLDVNDEISESADGIVFKAGEGEVANGTSLQAGSYLEISLSQGTTWISGLSENQVQMRLEQGDNMYQQLKRSLATMF